jgi:hypothetical protein
VWYSNYYHRIDAFNLTSRQAFTISTTSNYAAISGTMVVYPRGSDIYGYNLSLPYMPIINGLVCYGSSPIITKCTIQYCASNGIIGYQNAMPTITYLTAKNNGTAISSCNGTVSNCNLSNNTYGIRNQNGNITKNIFTQNTTAAISGAATGSLTRARAAGILRRGD